MDVQCNCQNDMSFTKIALNLVRKFVICLKKIVTTWPLGNSVKLRSKQSKQWLKIRSSWQVFEIIFCHYYAVDITKETKNEENLNSEMRGDCIRYLKCMIVYFWKFEPHPEFFLRSSNQSFVTCRFQGSRTPASISSRIGVKMAKFTLFW